MTTSAAVAARFEQQPREAAPFVKWVGGKGRLLSQLRPLLPRGVERMRHVEPFVGGGALFFARRPSRALLTDMPTCANCHSFSQDGKTLGQRLIDELEGQEGAIEQAVAAMLSAGEASDGTA